MIAVLILCLVALVAWVIYASQDPNKLGESASPKEVTPAAAQKVLPSHMFDPAPRRDTVFAAGRYHWKMDIVYIDDEGNEQSVVCSAPNTVGMPREITMLMKLGLPNGKQVAFDRIKSIDVQAASEETRARYRVKG